MPTLSYCHNCAFRRGLTVVGNTVVATTAFIMVPFLLFTLLAIPHIEPSNWLVYDLDQVR